MSFTPKPNIKTKNSNDSTNLSSSLNKRRIDAEIAAKKQREKTQLERQQLALRRQKEFTEKTHIWNEQILPRWNEVSQSPKVRELCSKGIPPNIRGKVWPLLIGNDLDIDEKMFEELNRKVLMIYGNKVVSKLQGSRDSAEGVEAGEENPDEYNPTSTYGLYRDSFDSDDGRGVFEGADFESTARTVSSARAPSADIPIPLLRGLHHQGGLVGGGGSAAPVSKQRLDVTEEEWFQNERNGSLDSETFELIQKQLFKRGASTVEDDQDQAGSFDNPGNDRYTVENYYDVGPAASTQVEGIALDSSRVGNNRSNRAMGSQQQHLDSSVDSHFTIESYNVIGSYVDHIKHTSHAIPIKNEAGEPIVSGLDHYHYSKSTSLGGEEGGGGEGEDLNELSFALATGGGTGSDSREIFTMSVSPATTAGGGLTPQPGGGQSFSQGNETPPSMRQRGASGLVPHSFADSPHTPPPRRRHSEEYLMDVGLLPSDGISRTDRRSTSKEASLLNEESVNECGHPAPQLTEENLSLAVPSYDNDPERQLYCHSASVTPLKTKQPFHQPQEQLTANDTDTDYYPVVASSSVLESSGLSTSSTGAEDPQRRKSASALTNLLMISEIQEAALREEKLRLEAAEREAAERAEREQIEKRKLSEERRNLPMSPQSASNAKLINTMSLIEWDLPRTFPTLGFFHDGGPMHTGLERILLCYACFRPEIGYVQGMSFLVATLLLYMDEFEAFKCLANLLGRRVNMDFYRLKKEAIDSYVSCFDHFFKKSLPLLYNHMCDEGVTSEMYLMDWNMALFTKALPLEVAAQVWDMYLYEGEMYIMCVGLGILKMYAPKLSTLGVEKISPFLLHLPEKINPDELFLNVNQIQINKKVYEKVRKKTAETVRAQFAEIEAARNNHNNNGMKKSRSAGNLQATATAEEQEGEDAAPPSSRLGRLHLGNSLKKALRATIGSGSRTSGENEATSASTGRETIAGGSPLRNNHATSSSSTAAAVTAGSSNSGDVSTSVHNNNGSYSTSSGNTTSSASSGSTTGAKKSGLECIPS